MPVYLVIGQTASSPVFIDHIVAADRIAAGQALKDLLGSGLAVHANGSRDVIQIALVELLATATITPNANPANATINVTDQAQAQIADLPALTVTSIAQANTAIQAMRTLINTLLAELRAAETLKT